VIGFAEESGLPTASATVVYEEAMLSMQLPATKERIVAEAARLLRPDGPYGIHELCLVPDDLDEAIARDLSERIHVGVRPLSASGWRDSRENQQIEVMAQTLAPMRPLEPWQILRDEGWYGATRFFFNVFRSPSARSRIWSMR
jgi:hypothetical protein